MASESGGWYTRTNITLTIGARDLVKNIQCHAVNQQIGETRVQSHTINVLCKFITDYLIITIHNIHRTGRTCCKSV